MHAGKTVAFTFLLALGAARAHADDYPPLSLYGMVRLDAIVDDSTMSDVRAPRWVEVEPGGSDAEMSVHPRLSRIGLSIDDWELNYRWNGVGQVEVDFAGGAPDADIGLRLRHAYVALSRGDKVEILIGQTWDLASPLIPSVNAETMMWDAGNTGDRRPQLRLSIFPTGRWRVAVAAGQTGAVDRQDVDGDGRLDGIESGLPTAQGLLEYRRYVGGGGEPLRIGVWGHVAREQLAAGTDMRSSAFGVHAYLPVGRHAVLMGEYFRGKNLDDLRGGIGQGWSVTRGREIDATGGWIEGAMILGRRHMFAVGESVDVVHAPDVEMGERISNFAAYAVLRWKPREAVQVGAEYSYWVTRYKPAPDMDPPRGTASRFNLHAAVSF